MASLNIIRFGFVALCLVAILAVGSANEVAKEEHEVAKREVEDFDDLLGDAEESERGVREAAEEADAFDLVPVNVHDIQKRKTVYIIKKKPRKYKIKLRLGRDTSQQYP